MSSANLHNECKLIFSIAEEMSERRSECLEGIANPCAAVLPSSRTILLSLCCVHSFTLIFDENWFKSDGGNMIPWNKVAYQFYDLISLSNCFQKAHDLRPDFLAIADISHGGNARVSTHGLHLL
jgi:hypothetical protein